MLLSKQCCQLQVTSPHKPLTKSFAGRSGIWSKILQKFIPICSKCRHLLGTSFHWIHDQGLRPWTPLSKLPNHLQVHSTTLAQILPTYIIPSRSLRSSSITISTPLPLQDLFHSLHLMSGISCLSMFPLPRRCKFSEGKHQLFLHVTLDSLHLPSKSELIAVSCRPPNAF